MDHWKLKCSQAVSMWLAVWFLASPVLAARFNLQTAGGDVHVPARNLLQCSEFPATAVPWTGGAVVSADQEVYLNQDYTSDQGIVVNGKLYIAQDRAIQITVPFILVNGTGLFQIGAPGCFHTQKVVITLTNGASTPKHGIKVIAADVMASLQFYGAHGLGSNSWVQLDGTAAVNATSITLTQTVDWVPGDRIVLSSTDYDPGQVEEAVIASIAGKVVTLTSPLKYMHYGSITYDVDQRGEVGLLTRTITIQGAEDSTYKAHVISTSNLAGGIHLEGVELFNVGQPLIGRYPIHFHMVVNAGYGSVVRSCSIWRSVFRAVTIHGTNGVLIENNVGYDVQGHMFFLEDGSEQDNKFVHNLGIGAKAVTRAGDLLGSDLPGGLSTFWITNPNNTFAENVATSTLSVGFWFTTRGSPRGLSLRSGLFTNVFPSRTPLQLFLNNKAHAVRQCLQWESPRFDDKDSPLQMNNTDMVAWVPRDAAGNRVITTLEGLTCHHAQAEGAWLRAAKARFYRCKFADVAEAYQIATNGQHPGSNSTSFTEECLFVGRSDNFGMPIKTDNQAVEPWSGRSCPKNPGGLNGFRMYDGPMVLLNNVFKNFNATACSTTVGSAALTIRRYNVFQMAASTSSLNNKFCRVENRMNLVDTDATGGLVSSIFDSDGSISSYPGSRLVRNLSFYNPKNGATSVCKSFDKGPVVACPHTYGGIEISNFPSVIALSQAIRLIGFPGETVFQRTLNYTTSQTLTSTIGNFNSLIASVGAAYSYNWPVFTPWQFTVALMYVNQGDRIFVALCLPPGTLLTAVKRGTSDFAANTVASAITALPNLPAGAQSAAWSSAANGSSYYYDSAAGMVYLTLQQRNTGVADPKGRDGCPAGGCDFVVVQTNLNKTAGGAGISSDVCASRVAAPPSDIANAWLGTTLKPKVSSGDDCTATITPARQYIA